MIIVSQDRKSVYNFDNILSIDVVLDEVFITDDISVNEGVSIGIYESYEQAEQVLDEIVAAIANGVKIYKMPIVEEKE